MTSEEILRSFSDIHRADVNYWRLRTNDNPECQLESERHKAYADAFAAGADALEREAALTEALRQAAKDLRELAALLGDEGYFLTSKETEMKAAAIDKMLGSKK